MSVNEWDAAQDQYLFDLYNENGPEWAQEHYDELHREHYAEAVKEFTAERLQSYYLTYPAMAGTAIGMMEEATILRKEHPNAALLFAASAVEITIKHLLVKPIVNGLVHNEAVADVVMALTPDQTGSDGFKTLLFAVLNKVAAVDLTSYKRPCSERMLWDEWKQLQKERNALIHNGVHPSSDTICFFEPVALEFLNVIFPRVLATLGLKISGYFMIEA